MTLVGLPKADEKTILVLEKKQEDVYIHCISSHSKVQHPRGAVEQQPGFSSGMKQNNASFRRPRLPDTLGHSTQSQQLWLGFTQHRMLSRQGTPVCITASSVTPNPHTFALCCPLCFLTFYCSLEEHFTAATRNHPIMTSRCLISTHQTDFGRSGRSS